MPVAQADTLPFLRQVAAFALLDEVELQQLSDQLEMAHFGIGQVICRAGEPADAFYLVYSGRARVLAMTPEGEVSVRMQFEADEPKPATGGEVTLFIGDKAVGKGRMDHTVPIRFSGYAGMDIGRDNGGVVDRAYEDRKPFEFTGEVKKVIFEVEPQPTEEDAHEVHKAHHHGHAAHGLSA